MTLLTDAQRAEMEHSSISEVRSVDPDGMCPNCVTPWKCNGPHEPEYAPTGRDICAMDRQPWPCDASRALSDVRELRGLLGALLGWLERVWVDDDYLTIPSHWAAALDADIDRARCSLARAEALTEGGRE